MTKGNSLMKSRNQVFFIEPQVASPQFYLNKLFLTFKENKSQLNIYFIHSKD